MGGVMETYRLKIKIGEHEFEAEGPTEVVQAQFSAFKEIIQSMAAESPKKSTMQVSEPSEEQATTSTMASDVLPLDKIMKNDGRVISLTVRATSITDAILLVAFGQKQYRNNDAITGGEILDGLRQSGQAADRIDRNLDKMATEGIVIKIGSGRGTRYRMTNQGIARAQEIAKSLIKLVA